MRYHNIFFAILKLYLWSIHIANNLILAISFGFKLNHKYPENASPGSFQQIALTPKSSPFSSNFNTAVFTRSIILLILFYITLAIGVLLNWHPL